jgi:coenzyme F420-reducing hydrogenase beta subunit
MNKLHAVGAGVIGVALSASAALAAAPHATLPTDAHGTAAGSAGDHGAIVSAVARDSTIVGGKHANHGGAVSLVARGGETQVGAPATADPNAGSGKPTDNHGAVVSAVAQASTIVGGKHANHGGAVSAVAHGAHTPNEHANPHATGHH